MESLQNADKETQHVGEGDALNWEYEHVTLYVAASTNQTAEK